MLGFFLWYGVEFCNPWLAQKQCAHSRNDDCQNQHMTLHILFLPASALVKSQVKMAPTTPGFPSNYGASV